VGHSPFATVHVKECLLASPVYASLWTMLSLMRVVKLNMRLSSIKSVCIQAQGGRGRKGDDNLVRVGK